MTLGVRLAHLVNIALYIAHDGPTEPSVHYKHSSPIGIKTPRSGHLRPLWHGKVLVQVLEMRVMIQPAK